MPPAGRLLLLTTSIIFANRSFLHGEIYRFFFFKSILVTPFLTVLLFSDTIFNGPNLSAGSLGFALFRTAPKQTCHDRNNRQKQKQSLFLVCSQHLMVKEWSTTLSSPRTAQQPTNQVITASVNGATKTKTTTTTTSEVIPTVQSKTTSTANGRDA